MRLNRGIRVAVFALSVALSGCGGGGGDSGGDPNPDPQGTMPFISNLQADTAQSVALTALVGVLYGLTGYVVDDSAAYRSQLSRDGSGNLQVAAISCGSGSASAHDQDATDEGDGTFLYQLGIQSAACQLAASGAVPASTETGDVSIQETRTSDNATIESYTYALTATHTATASYNSKTIVSTSDDTVIDGTRVNATAVSESVVGSVAETGAGGSALQFSTTILRRVDEGSPTLINGPQSGDQHFLQLDASSWGSEDCLSEIDQSTFDIGTLVQLAASGSRLAPIAGEVSGTLTPSNGDVASYGVTITFTSGNAHVAVTPPSPGTPQDFNFDTTTLLDSVSICGGTAAFWQQVGHVGTLTQRLQSH